MFELPERNLLFECSLIRYNFLAKWSHCTILMHIISMPIYVTLPDQSRTLSAFMGTALTQWWLRIGNLRGWHLSTSIHSGTDKKILTQIFWDMLTASFFAPQLDLVIQSYLWTTNINLVWLYFFSTYDLFLTHTVNCSTLYSMFICILSPLQWFGANHLPQSRYEDLFPSVGVLKDIADL